MQALDTQLDLLRSKLEGKIVSISLFRLLLLDQTPLIDETLSQDFEGQELADTYQKQILWASGVRTISFRPSSESELRNCFKVNRQSLSWWDSLCRVCKYS